MKISKNITYPEAIHSETAKRKGIDNTPNPTQDRRLRRLSKFLLLHPCQKVIKLYSYPEPADELASTLLTSSPPSVICGRRANPDHDTQALSGIDSGT